MNNEYKTEQKMDSQSKILELELWGDYEIGNYKVNKIKTAMTFHPSNSGLNVIFETIRFFESGASRSTFESMDVPFDALESLKESIAKAEAISQAGSVLAPNKEGRKQTATA
tara:strand:- start:34 stop:369 length:336 start_codon:yes stop_codon:yes gene_type:complete